MRQAVGKLDWNSKGRGSGKGSLLSLLLPPFTVEHCSLPSGRMFRSDSVQQSGSVYESEEIKKSKLFFFCGMKIGRKNLKIITAKPPDNISCLVAPGFMNMEFIRTGCLQDISGNGIRGGVTGRVVMVVYVCSLLKNFIFMEKWN